MLVLMGSISFAQKRGTKPKSAPKPADIVFAVMDDGKTLEPIGTIDKGELVDTSGSAGDVKAATNFSKTYYKPKTAYHLIFGGTAAGSVTVTDSKPDSECGKNLGAATVTSATAKIKGLVMGLATNMMPQNGKNSRRMPTAAERSEIEALVRAEFAKQKISSQAITKMKYQNLTAIDVDNDGKSEMVGSFWAENTPDERDILFFIAEKNAAGKYVFGYSDFHKATKDNLMGGAELKDVDSGRGHELLLDAMEYDGDSSAEIFTVNQAFEGNNFYVYSKRDGKWKRVYEAYNYHCAF